MNNTIFKTLYQEVHEFLIKNTEEGFVENQLVCPEYPMAETLEDVYKYLLENRTIHILKIYKEKTEM